MLLFRQLRPLFRSDHPAALYYPLIHPRQFFSRMDEWSARISPAILLFVWGCIIGLISVIFLNQAPAVSPSDRGALPPAVAGAIVAGGSVIFSGIGAVLITFLPGLWIHVIMKVMGSAQGKNALPAWQIVAFLTVSLMIFSTAFSLIRLAPGIGESAFLVLSTILLGFTARSLWVALLEVYNAGALRAAIGAMLAVAPLVFLFFFLSVARIAS